MSYRKYNLLKDAFITADPLGRLTLPGILAALSRDEVESFPALRPYQGMFWHMFLVQLAALALHGAGEAGIPEDEESWCSLLRGLTKDFPDDEPWCLVVDDWSKPAFMQAAVPDGVELKNPVPSPDALDLLITSKNHDLKQSVARGADPQDWLFALITLQTGEGYGGSGNHGIVRMNGGSSSRPMLALAPLPDSGGKDITPRPGAWFQRDVRVLTASRDEVLENSEIDYALSRGIGLTWLVSWLHEEQLQTRDLDIWFIEVCRRIRLIERDNVLCGFKGTSKATRIDAKHLNGAVGDPWAPVDKAGNKSLTLAGGDFDYRRLTELLFSGDWTRPILAEITDLDKAGETLAVVAAALSRGNSKTEGYKARIVPLSGRVSNALRVFDKQSAYRKKLHELAIVQVETIARFDKALRDALTLAIAGGEWGKKNLRDLYKYTNAARANLDRYADEIFFEHLWASFEAQESSGVAALRLEERDFARKLWQRTQSIFEHALPGVPCASLFRPRAEARARAMLVRQVKKAHPELFEMREEREEELDAV